MDCDSYSQTLRVEAPVQDNEGMRSDSQNDAPGSDFGNGDSETEPSSGSESETDDDAPAPLEYIINNEQLSSDDDSDEDENDDEKDEEKDFEVCLDPVNDSDLLYNKWLLYIIESLTLKMRSNQATVHFNAHIKLLQSSGFSLADGKGNDLPLPNNLEMMFKAIGLKPKDRLGDWECSFSCVSRCCMLTSKDKFCPICRMDRSKQDIAFWHRRFEFYSCKVIKYNLYQRRFVRAFFKDPGRTYLYCSYTFISSLSILISLTYLCYSV